MSKSNNVYKNNDDKKSKQSVSKRSYKTKLDIKDKKVKVISIRVTEEEYKIYKSNKEMREIIIKYIRKCLRFLYTSE